jgi:uncharacterized protein (DUF1778 family)
MSHKTDAKKTERFELLLTESDRKAFKSAATYEGISIAEMLRRCFYQCWQVGDSNE